MNKPTRLPFWLLFALVAIALAVQPGCDENQAMQDLNPITWDSPKMREIEKQWRSLEDTYNNDPEKIPGSPGKGKYAEHEHLIDELFRKRLSHHELSQLAGSAGSITDTSNQLFDSRLIEFMVEHFADAGDRESLVRLLSARCPGRVGYDMTIELRLTGGRKLKHPILILGEAYAKSQAPATRHDLANAIRRAFAGHGIQGKEDDQYVTSAMQWYNQEKENLVANPQYRRNEIFCPLEAYEMNPKLYDESYPTTFKRELLFTKKTPSQDSSKPRPESRPEPGQPESIVHNNSKDIPLTYDKEHEKRLAELDGTWQLIEATDNGEPVRDDKTKGMRITFNKGTFVWITRNGEKDEEFRVRLGKRQETTAIDLVHMRPGALAKEQTTPLIHELQEETISAIYALDGETLRMCFPWPSARQRPTSFEADKNSRETSFTFKRVRE